MGRLFLMHLDGNVYSCKHCKTHLGLAADIRSKAFHCKNGKAYLFNKVMGHAGFSVIGLLFPTQSFLWSLDGIQILSSIYPRHSIIYSSYLPIFSLRVLASDRSPLHTREQLSVNVTAGVKEDRMMITGMHTVSDIFCVCCGSIVGWKYEAAHETSQRYKEGKYILERYKVSGPDGSQYWVTHEAHFGGSDADDV